MKEYMEKTLRTGGGKVTDAKQFLDKDNSIPVQKVEPLLKQYILELVNSLTNTNLKIRAIAEETFESIC